MQQRTFIWLVGLALCASCADSDESSSEPQDLQAFGQAVAIAQCDKIFECCQGGELGDVFSGVDVATKEECVSAVQGYVRVFVVPKVEDAQQSGAVTVSGSQTACVNALKSQSCGAFSPSPNVDVFRAQACRDFIQPALETSGFCSEDWECKSGFCASVAGEGSCATPPESGQACVGQRCVTGLFCNATDLCEAKAVEGQPCDRNEACESDNCVDQEGQRVCGPPARVCQEGM